MVMEIDGHDMNDIVQMMVNTPFNKEKPSLIISNSVKGKGISFMENDNKWHGGGSISEFAEQALKEVDKYSKIQDVI